MEATLPRSAAPLHGEPPATAPVDAVDTLDGSNMPETVARDTSDHVADGVRPPEQAAPSAKPLREGARRFILGAGKHLATLGIALVAVLISVATWQHYVTAPWTRNGSVRVQVANVAPQVSGEIVELRVTDNQFVHKGDVLYVIDPFDFEVAVHVGKAVLDQRAADLEVKQAQFNRRQRLSNLATTPEEQQIFAGNALQAKAAYEAAAHQLAQAELNLKRTNVTVSGRRLRHQPPAARRRLCCHRHQQRLHHRCQQLLDRRLFRRDQDGRRVRGRSRGGTAGRLLQASSGTCKNRDPRRQRVERRIRHPGLPNVDPIYTWVRLAQRVPVRVAIDAVPPGVPLVSGMTATVTIRQPSGETQSRLEQFRTNFVDPVADLFGAGRPPRANCLQATSQQRPEVEAVPYSREPAVPPAATIAPGLAPGLDASPRLP